MHKTTITTTTTVPVVIVVVIVVTKLSLFQKGESHVCIQSSCLPEITG